jgi:hypothetical protein
MKKNVAHSVIINFHRLYIPKINEEIHNALAIALPSVTLQPMEVKQEQPKKTNNVIENAMNSKPEFKINTAAKSPNDEPIISKEQKATDSKKELLEQMERAKQLNK